MREDNKKLASPALADKNLKKFMNNCERYGIVSPNAVIYELEALEYQLLRNTHPDALLSLRFLEALQQLFKSVFDFKE